MILWAVPQRFDKAMVVAVIRYHFIVKISLRFGTAGWYNVMKGKIRLFVLFRWRRACVLC